MRSDTYSTDLNVSTFFKINLLFATDHNPHLPWRPVNLKMSLQRQFHFPPALFTCLMKNWGVPEIIAGELLHSGQNSRGICKSIKNDIFWLENNFYLHYSHVTVFALAVMEYAVGVSKFGKNPMTLLVHQY